jgi:hypothetical protein
MGSMLLLVAACTSNSGVMPIGPNTYTVSRQATTVSTGTGGLKTEAIREANQYCVSQNKVMQVVNTFEAQPPFTSGNFPGAEVQFMCLNANQSIGTSQTISPDVIASGPLTGAMLDKYDIVAVLPFADAPHATSSGSTVADIVSTQLLDLDFAVVERTRLQQLFEEQGLQLRSADEQANAIRIGRLAGAKAVVVGAVQQWETRKEKGAEKSFLSLSFRLVDVETGVILFGGQGQFKEPISEVPQMTAGIITGTIFERMAIQVGLRGSGRIGFHHDMVDRFVGKASVVRSVMRGLPAERAGLKAGDIILSCNGSNSVTWKRKRDILRACSVELGQDLMLEVARGEQRLMIRATAVSRY